MPCLTWGSPPEALHGTLQKPMQSSSQTNHRTLQKLGRGSPQRLQYRSQKLQAGKAPLCGLEAWTQACRRQLLRVAWGAHKPRRQQQTGRMTGCWHQLLLTPLILPITFHQQQLEQYSKLRARQRPGRVVLPHLRCRALMLQPSGPCMRTGSRQARQQESQSVMLPLAEHCCHRALTLDPILKQYIMLVRGQVALEQQH